jgi:hypothetical protein
MTSTSPSCCRNTKGIAGRLGVTYDYAQHELVAPHGYLYRTYWRWSHDALYGAVERGLIRTRYGWQMHVTDQATRNTLLNWRIQAAGGDVLRLAIIGLVRKGIRVAAPIHDAVLTVCDEVEVEQHVATVQRIMRKAAKVSIGWEIPVDSRVVHHPDRYADSRGTDMFQTIIGILEEIERRPTEPKGENPHHTAIFPRTYVTYLGDVGGSTLKNIIGISPYVPDRVDIPDIPDVRPSWSRPSWLDAIHVPDM